MKLAEFKAWFVGFTEGMEGPPSAKQWERIREQVAAIDGTPISYPVYVDRYNGWWGTNNYPRYYGLEAYATSGLPCHNSDLTRTTTPDGHAALANQVSFDSCTAMYAAGRAEATSFIHDNGV